MTVEALFKLLPASIVGPIAAIILAVIGFDRATKWLDAREEKAQAALAQLKADVKSEVKAEMAQEISDLRQRVTHLEACQTEARAHIVKAVGMAGALGDEGRDIRDELTKAAESLK